MLFKVVSKDEPDGSLQLIPRDVVVAGWTGRDASAVQHHIDELAQIGVAPPSSVPLYYRVGAELVTQSNSIDVLGNNTSGEIEPLILASDGKFWLGLGSDHTDRQLETVSVAASKQICPKPIAATLWPFDEVQDHLDALLLSCRIKEGGDWVPYQQGSFAGIRPIPSLIKGSNLATGGVLLCGTLAAIGGVRPAVDYEMVLSDPVLDRHITLIYHVRVLPMIA